MFAGIDSHTVGGSADAAGERKGACGVRIHSTSLSAHRVLHRVVDNESRSTVQTSGTPAKFGSSILLGFASADWRNMTGNSELF